ncbi:uncharacterized protein BHQ10_007517 [Talaromyces amestolkiae]|uniref:Uncharacterized protein n=1 Tax=Talaromyces amestolkiae TaxID=1196081 RepID=A0A364L6R3_TALAM|nr:uncharacterized protein BHQ10_007517 [Talaromyces amestolkiae]RAO71505.1 hypothetical protein BHQ10_007517 [Talaromyces amestolkiae]
MKPFAQSSQNDTYMLQNANQRGATIAPYSHIPVANDLHSIQYQTEYFNESAYIAVDIRLLEAFRGMNAAYWDTRYNQWNESMREAFYDIAAARLDKACIALLNLIDWLETHAKDLGQQIDIILHGPYSQTHDIWGITGLFRDNELTLKVHLPLWKTFNYCWLSLLQKQKDSVNATICSKILQPGSTRLLDAWSLEDLGLELIRFCDWLAPHGLVDYERGMWEEEILDGKIFISLSPKL